MPEEELQEYLDNRAKFVTEAIEAAIAEMQKRGRTFSDEELASIRQEFQVRKEAATDTNIQKPKKVSTAINLLIVSILLQIINSIITEATTEFKSYSSGQGLFVTISTLGLMIIFVYQMNIGENWARTTFLGLFILGGLIYPFKLIPLFKVSPIVGLLSVILTIIQIIALIMIYSKVSNEWFNPKKTNP